MTPDLASLTQPLTAEEFLSHLRTRTRRLTRGSSPSRFESLINWATLDHLIETGYPLERLHVLKESMPIPEHFYVKDGRTDAAALGKLLDQGVSIVINGIHEYVPALRQLCMDIASQTRDKVSAEAVLTTGKGGALRVHYDPEDVVVLQIAGTKRWRIHDATVKNPVHDLPQTTPPTSPPVFDEVLQAGDFLFVPGGQWHHCENGPERSLHVTLLIDPPNGSHVLSSLAHRWLADPQFRRPLSRDGDAAERQTHEAALKQHLIDQIGRLSLAEFLESDAKGRAASPRLRAAGRPR